MDPKMIVILEIISMVIEKGVPSVLKVMSQWQLAGDEVTTDDIEALRGKLKDPASYFEKP